MRGPLIQLPLTLTSLCAFAFNPGAKGWYGESALSPTISSVKYQGAGNEPLYTTTTTSFPVRAPAQAAFTLFGISAKQTAGWREWFSIELTGGYSGALNGSANNQEVGSLPLGGRYALPASLNLWDLSLESFTSVALDSTRSVYFEPAVGYGWVVAHMRTTVENLPRKNWVRTDFYGPSLAVYMRLFVSENVSLRFGSKYQASQLRTKKYSLEELPALGTLTDERHSRARRHSLGALMRFDYTWRSWVYLHAAIDYQSWSAGGSPQPVYQGEPLSGQFAMTTRLGRTRFTLGADFAY